MSLNHQLKSEGNDINYINEHYEELITKANKIITLAKECQFICKIKLTINLIVIFFYILC